MSSTSLRAIDLFIEGEPGALITVTETPDGKLNFKVQVTDVISGQSDKADIADLRGLFFHVADENLLSSLSITGANVTTYAIETNKVMQVQGDANMNGEVGKAVGPFDIGIEFGEQGIGKDDIRETSFTLSAPSPLSLEFVRQQYFGLRLTSVSDNGLGRELSLKLAGQMTGTPKAISVTPDDQTDPGDGPDETGGNPPSDTGSGEQPLPGISYDDLIEAGDGNDTIYGGLGDDEMQGEGGDDLIIGGKDNGTLTWEDGLKIKIGDNLYGNTGRDTYLYKAGDGVDLIWDFEPGSDVIKISGYNLADIHAITMVREINNRIATDIHDKIAIILNESGDAIIFNDFPAPSESDTAIIFADGTKLSSARLLELAMATSIPLAEGYAQQGTPNATSSVHTNAAPLLLYGGNGEDMLIGGLGDDKLYGNEGVNGLNGRTGNDELYGGNVADTILGSDGDDFLYGNAGDDLLVGGAGNDKLYGTGGVDVIFGDDAEGIDIPALLTTYTVPVDGEEVSAEIRIVNNWWGGFQAEISITANESVNAWDIFLKSKFNIDSIWGAVTAGEASWANGVIYDLDNASWNGALAVGQKTTIGFTARTGVNGIIDAAHIMAGLGIAKRISAEALPNESLLGTLGNTMRGFAGDDTLWGTTLNDTFYVDSTGDNVIETSASNADEVITSVSYTLAANVEKLSTNGNSALALNGNSLNNTIVGNGASNTIKGGNGNDTMDGGAGKDILLGGSGKDWFVFSTKPSKTANLDTIKDFSAKDDTIRLENEVFRKFTKIGSLNKAYFVIGSTAKDANDYILYDKKTGYLRYDADGSGKGAALIFAKMTAGLKLTSGDFVIF